MPAEHLPTDKPLEEQPDRAVARRRLLKVLVAAGGVFTASSVLPGKWMRPIVEVGVLPSHAQASVIPSPLCYTATPSHTPTRMPVCYTQPPVPTCYTPTATPRTQTLSSTATPIPAAPQARRELLKRLLSEGRFPKDVARKLK